jgi:hypothetical protein
MKLDTISKIEQHITDALLSSPHIPPGVNIVRLAATQDEEGITTLVRSIVVRYTGSSVQLKQTIPQHIVRSMSFEIIISSQSYLTESGHDGALQMCAASYMSLNNSIPFRTGSTIETPFHMTSESFQGLTDSSHYVYVQNWEVSIDEISPQLTLDPCVLEGTCAKLFPEDVGGELLPGDIVYGNDIYAPVAPPAGDNDYDEELCGVYVRGDDLYYTHLTELPFLQDWKKFVLVSTDTFDESGTFLICHAYEAETGYLLFQYYAAKCGDRKMLGIMPISYLGQGGSVKNKTYLKGANSLGYANVWPRTTVYLDPTDPDGATTTVRFGWVMRVETGVTMLVDGEDFVKVNASPFIVGWVKKTEVTIYVPERFEKLEGCINLEAENDEPDKCV